MNKINCRQFQLKELCLNHAILLIILADVLGVLTAIFHVSLMDIIGFDLKYWVPQLQQENYFGMYHAFLVEHIVDGAAINYPPMYPTYLYILANTILPEIGEINVFNGVDWLFQICMKSFSILGLIFSQTVLYKRISPRAALLWTYCLPIWYISFVWGQRDAMMGFFIVMMLYSMNEQKIYEPCLWFVAMCLLKPQGAYLVVIYGLYIITSNHTVRQKILSVGLGAGIALAVFLPFMIYEHDILLPFKLYLGVANFGTSDFCWSTGNIYWLFTGADVPDYLMWLTPFCFFAVCIGTFLWFGRTKDIISTGFVYMFSIFMFTIGQHERYILYHACIFVIIYVITNKRADLYWSMNIIYGIYLFVLNTWITIRAFLNYDPAGFRYQMLTAFLVACFNCIVMVSFIRHHKDVDNTSIK